MGGGRRGQKKAANLLQRASYFLRTQGQRRRSRQTVKLRVSEELFLGRSILTQPATWRTLRRHTVRKADIKKPLSLTKPPHTFTARCLKKAIRIRCRAWHTSPQRRMRYNNYRLLRSRSSFWQLRPPANQRRSGSRGTGFYGRLYIVRPIASLS